MGVIEVHGPAVKVRAMRKDVATSISINTEMRVLALCWGNGCDCTNQRCAIPRCLFNPMSE